MGWEKSCGLMAKITPLTCRRCVVQVPPYIQRPSSGVGSLDPVVELRLRWQIRNVRSGEGCFEAPLRQEASRGGARVGLRREQRIEREHPTVSAGLVCMIVRVEAADLHDACALVVHMRLVHDRAAGARCAPTLEHVGPRLLPVLEDEAAVDVGALQHPPRFVPRVLPVPGRSGQCAGPRHRRPVPPQKILSRTLCRRRPGLPRCACCLPRRFRDERGD